MHAHGRKEEKKEREAAEGGRALLSLENKQLDKKKQNKCEWWILYPLEVIMTPAIFGTPE